MRIMRGNVVEPKGGVKPVRTGQAARYRGNNLARYNQIRSA